MLNRLLAIGGASVAITQKVKAMNVSPKIEHRIVCEHIHGYQLVEALLPVCEKHGLRLVLSDGEDTYTINKPADIIPVMNQCDEEWLCVQDTETDDDTFLSVFLIYGNNADNPEDGRGEMVADWSGCNEWYEVFDPILSAFIDNREVGEVTE